MGRPSLDTSATDDMARNACVALRARTADREDLGLSLAGIGEERRRRLADRLRAPGLPVFTVRAAPCAIEIEPLACSRTAFVRASAPRSAAEDAEIATWSSLRSTGSRRHAGLATLLDRADAPSTSLRIHTTTERELAVDWVEDLRLARGWAQVPLPPELAGEWSPPVDISELSGPDCAAATHVLVRAELGSLEVRLLAGGAPGALVDGTSCPLGRCSEPIAITMRPLGRRGCPAGLVPSPRGCTFVTRQVPWLGRAPTRVDARAGQLTEQGAQAKRLYQSGRFRDAMVALERVAARDTGDDEGNVQIATFEYAVAAHHAGDVAGSNAVVQWLLSQPSHLGNPPAAAWAELLGRRAER